MKLVLNIDVGTKSRGLNKAEKKFYLCNLSCDEVKHDGMTNYTALSSVTLNDELLTKYGITPDNFDSIEIDLYKIVFDEFINDKRFFISHIEKSDCTSFETD